jgi:hypothetical protein
MKRSLLGVLPLCTLLLLPVGLSASDRGEVQSLRGLKEVYVVVEPLESGAEKWGLTTDQVLTDVQLRLRRAGIHVTGSVDDAFLYVGIDFFKDVGNRRNYAIRISLNQQVILERDPTIHISAATWNYNSVGYANPDELRKYLGDDVDRFINDYLAANPPKP